MKPITYPEDIQCVFQEMPGKRVSGCIFIGNLQAAQNMQTLRMNSIRAVVSVAKGAFLQHSEEDLPSYLYIPAEDCEQFDLHQYFDKCLDFIQRNLPYTNVLVHCLAGVSRSVTIVIAFLMKKLNTSFAETYKMVKSKRQIIHPNNGFIAQLKKHELRITAEHKHRITIGSSSSRQEYYYSKASQKSPERLRTSPSHNPQKLFTTNLKNDYYKYTQKPNLKHMDDHNQIREMKKHHQYMQERIHQLREEILGKKEIFGKRRVGSISANKIGNQSRDYSPTTKRRYDSPSKASMKKFDNYPIKTKQQKTDKMNRFLRVKQ